MRNTEKDRIRGLFLLTILAFFFGVFFLVPSLRPSSLLTILNVLLLAPIIDRLEKKGVERVHAILISFLISGLCVFSSLVYATQVLSQQWTTVLDLLPTLGEQAIEKVYALQKWAEDLFQVKVDLGVTAWISKIGSNTQTWLITHLPQLLGSLASAFFLVPIFSFFLLRDQQKILIGLTHMIPSTFQRANSKVIGKVSLALSRYLRAKFLEAFLVGGMTALGLLIVGAPYAGLFAIIAGVTNLIPYLGPVIGMVPAMGLIGFTDPSLLWPTFFVYLVVNAIDMVLIFPILVAKLVNLSPLSLLAAVAVGQEFYGVVGMLISVPIASILKIIYQELWQIIYED